MGIDTSVRREFAEMEPYLPKGVKSILDIGCGPAQIDVLLGQHYGAPLEIHLMDGDGTKEQRVGYRPQIEAWNDRRAARRMVKEALGDRFKVLAWEPDPNLTIRGLDLIISLKSWCHHYPCAIYLPLVNRSLRPGGKLIVDIRNKTDGLEVLREAGYRQVVKIGETRKCERWLLE